MTKIKVSCIERQHSTDMSGIVSFIISSCICFLLNDVQSFKLHRIIRVTFMFSQSDLHFLSQDINLIYLI